jgi:DNA-binding SARP family transcriptional activator
MEGPTGIGPGKIAVRIMGTLTVSVHGCPLRNAEVGSRKGRRLLAALAVRPGHWPVDDLTDVVWGDAPPRDPAANVATLVSRLRRSLGTDAIIGTRSGYRLGDVTRTDLLLAADLVREAETRLKSDRPAAALMAAWRATHLLDRGFVLPEYPTAQWAHPARTQRAQLVRQAWHTAAEAALRMDDVSSALSAAEAALAADSLDETACRLVMRAYQAAGLESRALLAYQRLRMTLANELGVDPAPVTRDLHQAILRDTGQATRTAG